MERFIVDQMLGTLAKWLRVLGYDTVFSPALDDPDLARIARAEGRILLTRDTQLAKRKGLRVILVDSDQPREQILQVAGALNLPLERPTLSRCLRCNELLVDASPDSVADIVPPYVLATQSHFRRCPSCGRIYWQGTHWARMQQRLRDLRR